MENRKTILMERYELGRFLGQGSYGKVYYATSLKTGQSVAIKILKKDKIIEDHLEEQVIREITAMRLLKHPNIVELFEVMASKKKIYLVMEYAKGGELYNKVVEGRLPKHVARGYFQQLINAVDYCHSRGVYHRDLKPDNLLLDDEGNLKVSDFGWSAVVDINNKNVLHQTVCGGKSYHSPEVIKREKYDGAKSDIWSCGVILFLLLAGYHPFQDQNPKIMFLKIVNSKYKCPRRFSSEIRNLIKSMLDPHPNSRIAIAEIQKNRWLRRGLDDEQLIHTSETNQQVPGDVSESSNSFGSSCCLVNQDLAKIPKLNAFDIISLSAGLDLSSMFDDSNQREEVRFTTKKPISTIVSELENMAQSLKLKVMKEAGVLRMEGLEEGRRGVLAINIEIFEITPSIHLVEIKQSDGDTLEYQKLLKEGIRPALKHIVWAWLCDPHNLSFAQILLCSYQSFVFCLSMCLGL